jgi:sugar phosphate isomerase/epimerase
MKTSTLTRREFTRRTAALAALGSVLPSQIFAQASAPGTGGIRLGGPAFAKSEDPEELAQAHRKLGYSAAYCPGLALKDSDRIRAVSAAFAKHNVVIAEVGRWVNLLDADEAKRKKNLEFVTEGLALAEAVGARCCVDIAGSFNPKSWFGPHPENFTPKFFDASVENARKIIDAVKPKRAKFTFEMMGWAMPDTAECYLKLIKAIDREAFAVHLDPCNAVNSPEKFYRNADLLNDCFDKLGRYIMSCHAKDLTWDIEMNVHFREVVPGTGSIDYTTYLRRLAQLPQRPPLMIEHLSKPEEYEQGKKFIVETGEKAGLTFA